MNQLWAWLITGLVTGAVAPTVLLALRTRRRWRRPVRLPVAAIGGAFVVVHAAITISLVVGFQPPVWAALHVVLLAAGVVYWSPIFDGDGRLGGPDRLVYLLLTSPMLDLAGAAVMAFGHVAGGIAMIVGMMPLNATTVVFGWRWMVEEERRVDEAMESAVAWTTPERLPPAGHWEGGAAHRSGRPETNRFRW